jgi:hypothetical protein
MSVISFSYPLYLDSYKVQRAIPSSHQGLFVPKCAFNLFGCQLMLSLLQFYNYVLKTRTTDFHAHNRTPNGQHIIVPRSKILTNRNLWEPHCMNDYSANKTIMIRLIQKLKAQQDSFCNVSLWICSCGISSKCLCCMSWHE